jgi:hypothetical protein
MVQAGRPCAPLAGSPPTSSEGSEFIRQPGEHRTSFVRRYLDTLGQEGWEVAAVQPLTRIGTSYFVLKRPATAAKNEG